MPPDREFQALQKAIRANDLVTVRRILTEDPDLALSRPKDQLAPLLVAAYARSDQLVQELLGCGVVPDVFEATILGDTARLRSILSVDRTAANRFSSDGWTPLHIAVGYGQLEAARMLLAHGASLTAVSENGIRNQPLQAAVAGGHPPLVRLILDAGADPNHQSHGGFTAAHLAAEGGDTTILELLRASGADLDRPAEGGKTPLDIAVEHKQKAAVDWLQHASVTSSR